jgi:uncharacterized Zn-binding protein involved in type VI secretion
MASIAKNGSHTQDVTANDITYQIYNPNKFYHPQTCGGGVDSNGDPIPTYDCSYYTGGYDDFTGSSTIHGTVVGSGSKMQVNGVSVALVGDSVTETETFNVSGAENIQNANGGTGSVTSGSSKVFLNGVSVARVGSSVQTHTSPTTTIADGDSKVNIS